MKMLAQGAEARIYLENGKIVKHRFEKKYRHPTIDKALIKYRTRREARVIEKLAQIGFPAPRLVEMKENNGKMVMSFINGDLIKDILKDDYKKIGREIGRKIGILHRNNIIHGDLTTSNMILNKNDNEKDNDNKEIHFIDFGLSFFSERVEDKAVDLHLLKQALESKHYEIYEDCFKEVIEGYKEGNPEWEKILKRFEIVERRGRNKEK